MEAVALQGVLDPQGPVAAAERMILMDAAAIMAVVVLPVIGMTLAFAWWFRRGNPRAQRRPEWANSGAIEVTVWAIPSLVVLFLGGMAWIGSHDLAPGRPIAGPTPPLDVQVVSLDWKWLFIYPVQGVASVNRLVVPANTPLRLRLTSASVMNSFFVPQLGSQIVVMAGMTSSLNLQADRPGSYEGLSSQFSGAGFSDMRFETMALSPEAFERWAGSARGRAGTLNADSYAGLARPGVVGSPVVYGEVAPGLFAAILAASVRPPSPRMAME